MSDERIKQLCPAPEGLECLLVRDGETVDRLPVVALALAVIEDYGPDAEIVPVVCVDGYFNTGGLWADETNGNAKLRAERAGAAAPSKVMWRVEW